VQVGLAPLVVLAALERCIGQRAAADLILTGQIITAERAFEIGLVSRLVSAENLENEVEKVVHGLAQGSKQALSAAKSALGKVAREDYLSVTNSLVKVIAELSATSEAREGMLAFLEKRKPKWD
jgi:enoyl-CoA hydratase/carnithine racemase